MEFGGKEQRILFRKDPLQDKKGYEQTHKLQLSLPYLRRLQ